jgi:SNF2 family DNA or RNA helicase
MMVKITQNNDQLLISVNNEERGSLHSLIELLTENDRGTVKGNTIEITTKNHIYPLHQMLTSINNICAKENIDVTFDSESEKVLEEQKSIKKQLESLDKVGSEIKSRSESNSNVQLPSIFKRTLKDYQQDSVDHLYSIGNGANFSVPGSGKTTIALAAYSLMKQNDQVDHILVVCPRSAFMSWEDEFDGCFERPSNTVRLNRENIDKKHQDADIFLATYQLMSYRPDDFVRLLRNHRVLMILDESHNIKNGKKTEPTSWAKVARDIAPFAEKRMVLSGTPCPQALDDLWAQIDFLYPNVRYLESYDYFKKYTKSRAGFGQEFTSKIENVYRRISKDDLDLRKPHFEVIDVPMDSLQTKIYNSVQVKVIEALLKESQTENTKMSKWRGDKGGKIIRLLQAASNPTLFTKNDEQFDFSSAKIDLDSDTSELIDKYAAQGQIPTKLMEACKKAQELAESGEKVIIWTSFLHNIKMIEEQLLKNNVRQNQLLVIDGSVPKDDQDDIHDNREKRIRLFKEDPNYKILIATPPSCSESVSLHKNSRNELVCKHAIYFDRTFNAAHYMQSKDRIHRVGMKDVTVTYWIFRSAYPAENGQKPVVCHIDDWTHNRLKNKETRMLGALGDKITTFDMNTNHTKMNEEEVVADTEDYIRSLKENGVIK